MHKNPYRCSLGSMQGRSAASPDEMEKMRRRAYVEDGILTIRLSDPKLSDDERDMLHAIAEARYGYGGAR